MVPQFCSLFFIQRFIPLGVKERPKFEEAQEATDEDSVNVKASFRFPSFPDSVEEVRNLCETRCDSYAKAAEDFLFINVEQQSLVVPTPMTKRDYLFNELSSATAYFCQYDHDENANFGGSWILVDESCFCSDSCDPNDYFGFTGCADLLNRIDIPCTKEKPCTRDRICQFENNRIEVQVNTISTKFFQSVDNICLNTCAELAGFADFAALAAVSGSLGALSSNLFGVANTPFGTALGAPATLLPGMFQSMILPLLFLRII